MGALAYASLLLDLVPLALKGVSAAVDALTTGRNAVKAMVAENRDPTEAEWAALNAVTADLSDKLHSDDH